MTDDLVQRLREVGRDGTWKSRRNTTTAHPMCIKAADRIEALQVEIERLKIQLSVESEPSPYCPICGSCGDEGCCGPKRCMYPAAAWQAGYKAGIEAAAKALEADARLCDCAALEANECACGAWDDYKSITSARAVEIVRKLRGQGK